MYKLNNNDNGLKLCYMYSSTVVMEGFENIKESRINAVRIKETHACDPAPQPGLGRGPIGATRCFFLYYEYVGW